MERVVVVVVAAATAEEPRAVRQSLVLGVALARLEIGHVVHLFDDGRLFLCSRRAIERLDGRHLLLGDATAGARLLDAPQRGPSASDETGRLVVIVDIVVVVTTAVGSIGVLLLLLLFTELTGQLGIELLLALEAIAQFGDPLLHVGHRLPVVGEPRPFLPELARFLLVEFVAVGQLGAQPFQVELNEVGLGAGMGLSTTMHTVALLASKEFQLAGELFDLSGRHAQFLFLFVEKGPNGRQIRRCSKSTGLKESGTRMGLEGKGRIHTE